MLLLTTNIILRRKFCIFRVQCTIQYTWYVVWTFQLTALFVKIKIKYFHMSYLQHAKILAPSLLPWELVVVIFLCTHSLSNGWWPLVIIDAGLTNQRLFIMMCYNLYFFFLSCVIYIQQVHDFSLKLLWIHHSLSQQVLHTTRTIC